MHPKTQNRVHILKMCVKIIKMIKYYIGIDTGTHTGVAVWNAVEKKFEFIGTMKIHQAFLLVLKYPKNNTLVKFEDARLRVWFGSADREKLQGAGSIKRDCTIWQDFLTDNNIEFMAVPPKNNTTKTKSDYFKILTHWQQKTNEHSRDAAMLVLGL